MVTELLWFLRGDTNIKYLVDNECYIWDGDAFKNYETKAVVGDIIDSHYEPATGKWHLYNKEEFITMIKKNERFCDKWGQLGPVYGKQWRDWNGKWKLTEEDNTNFEKWRQNLDRKGIDQIANAIHLLKTDPDSRRILVNSWNVADLPEVDYRTDDELYEDYLKQNK
jgi:thymidylate synthase